MYVCMYYCIYYITYRDIIHCIIIYNYNFGLGAPARKKMAFTILLIILLHSYARAEGEIIIIKSWSQHDVNILIHRFVWVRLLHFCLIQQ